MLQRPAILRLLVFVITFLAFARLTACEFTWWDDQETIHQNPRLNPPTWGTLYYYWTYADVHDTMGLYVPVTYTVWSGLAKIARMDRADSQGIWLNSKVFHTANVLLHAIIAVLVFQVIWRLLGNETAAALAALLFSLHPVQVETVGWVSGTKDLLYALFAVSALLMYVRSVQLKSQCRYAVGIFLFGLSMLSKPTGVVTPLMAGVISVLLLNRSVRQTLIALIPWFLLMIPCVIWTQRVQPPSGISPLAMWDRPLIAADAVTFYLSKLIWPATLCLDYGHNPQTVMASHLFYFTWILPAVLTAFLCWKFNRLRPLVAGTLLFLTPLLPVLGFISFEFQSISTTADHYLYLPMLGVSLCAAWLLTQYRSRGALVFTALILAALLTRSILQEPVWQNTQTLLDHTLAINPRSTASMGGLGYLTGRDARRMLDGGNPREARALFDESIGWYQKVLQISPESAPSMANLALDYQKIGRQDLGLEQLHKIVAIEPALPAGLQADPLTVAHLLIDFKDLPGAIAWLDDVLRREPGNFQAAILREQAIEHLSASSHGAAAR